MKGQSEKPTLKLINTGLDYAVDLPSHIVHQITAEAQQRGVARDKILREYLEEAAEKAIEQACAERGISRQELSQLYETMEAIPEPKA